MRAISMERAVSRHAEGSCLVKFGDTHVLCTASLEERVPPWLRGGGEGWVTAEYGMLPRATKERMRREASAGKQSGRTQEIQRLIGRSLRAIVDRAALGERQISVDCDVLQADGGTRTAAITGAWVALSDCVTYMMSAGHDHRQPADRSRGRHLLRHRRRHPGSRPRLSGGLHGPHRRQFRHDRLGRYRRGAGHRRGRAVLARRADGAARPRPGRYRPAGGPAEADGLVTGTNLRTAIGERLVLATHNKGKLAEFGTLLSPLGIQVVSAGAMGLPEPEETGTTFAANAALKAEAATAATGLPALADDSGLTVEALGGDPGIYSARWAGPDKDFGHAMRRVLDGLAAAGASTSETRRGAFVACLALALPGQETQFIEGRCEGTLAEAPRGDNGFGYDPLFVPDDGDGRTFGEMDSTEKHGGPAPLSHRARAVATFMTMLGVQAAS